MVDTELVQSLYLALEDWSRFVWTYETEVTSNPYKNIWVTRLAVTDAIHIISGPNAHFKRMNKLKTCVSI